MQRSTYYDVLGVCDAASADEIERSYQRALRKHLPGPERAGSETFARLVHEAYAVLNDPQKRAWYDESLRQRHTA